MPKRVEILVSFDLPDGATLDDADAYVDEAVRSWRGRASPDDPLFSLDTRTLQTGLVKSKRGKRQEEPIPADAAERREYARAALTGLLAREEDPEASPLRLARDAFVIAEAMLQESRKGGAGNG